MKRAFDFAASAAGLLVLAPVVVLLAIAVRLETPGSPIFAQSRVGRDGRHFTCYKLRTMYVGTGDQPTHAVQKSAVTRLGHWLRKLKLDEIPQLYNVLVGEMSLVGPRPCLPSQKELVDARRRLGVLTVRPGVTGLAQIQDIDMSNPDRLAAVDAEYVRTRSFKGDMGLLLATLLGRGMNVDRIKSNRTS